MAGGHFYLGGGTAVQQATGHVDSPDAMYEDKGPWAVFDGEGSFFGRRDGTHAAGLS